MTLLSALLPWLLSACSLLGFLFCFWALQKSQREVADGKRPLANLPDCDALKEQIRTLGDRVVALESYREDTAARIAGRTGINLTKRTQALRQYREGQDSSTIARSLEMSKAEIDLLIKVQSLSSYT